MEGNTFERKHQKKSFPTVFKGAVDQITLSTVVNGFRKSGLYPLDPGKVDYSKCVRDHLQQECEEAELSSPVSDPAVFRMRCGLRFLEERIGHTKLQLFESAYGGEWQGDIEDTSLYLLWSSAKEIAEASVDDGPSGGGGVGLSGRGNGDPSGGGNDVDDDPSGGGNYVDDDPSGGGNDVDDDPSSGGHHDGGDDDLSVGGDDDPSGRGDGDPSGGGNDVDDDPSGGGHHDPSGGGDDDLSVGGDDDPSGGGHHGPSGGGNDVDDGPSGGGDDDHSVGGDDGLSGEGDDDHSDGGDDGPSDGGDGDPLAGGDDDPSDGERREELPSDDPNDVRSNCPSTSSLHNRLPTSVTPILTKHLVDRLITLSKPSNQTGRKRKRSLSASVYALTSKKW